MKRTIGFASVFLLFVATIYAAPMLTHTDRKAQFSIKYPKGWTKTINKEGINASFATKDSLAMVQVIRADVEAGVTSDAFLSEIEKQVGEQYVNQLPEDKRHAQEADLQNMNAEEGSVGYYTLESSGQKIHQFIMVVRKGTKILTITVTFADIAEKGVQQNAIEVADTIRFL